MVLTVSKKISYTSNNISVIFYPFNLIMLAIMVPHFAMSSSTSLQSKFRFKPWQQMIQPTRTSPLVLQCLTTRFCFQAKRIESDNLVWVTGRAHNTSTRLHCNNCITTYSEQPSDFSSAIFI